MEPIIREAMRGEDVRYTRVPCVIDQIIDLNDEDLVKMFVNAMNAVEPESRSFFQIIVETWATVRDCEKELLRRGRGDLLESALKKIPKTPGVGGKRNLKQS